MMWAAMPPTQARCLRPRLGGSCAARRSPCLHRPACPPLAACPLLPSCATTPAPGVRAPPPHWQAEAASGWPSWTTSSRWPPRTCQWRRWPRCAGAMAPRCWWTARTLWALCPWTSPPSAAITTPATCTRWFGGRGGGAISCLHPTPAPARGSRVPMSRVPSMPCAPASPRLAAVGVHTKGGGVPVGGASAAARPAAAGHQPRLRPGECAPWPALPLCALSVHARP